MKLELLQNLRSSDPAAFEALMRHLGYASAACYRLSGDVLVRILETTPRAGEAWPVAVKHISNYTTPGTQMPLLGFAKPPGGAAQRKHWPKGTTLYFPEQALQRQKIVLAVVNAPGKRTRPGELNGPLEALANRMRGLFRDATQRAALSEAGIQEHVRMLGLDLHMLLDHELRTPLASIAGYSVLLRDMNPSTQAESWQEYWGIIDSELANANDVLGRLTLALPAGGAKLEEERIKIDAAEVVHSLCDEAISKAKELVGEDAAEREHLRFLKNTDQACIIEASPRIFRSAVWEVLKNALAHARSNIEVSVYTSDQMLVIDVMDDGPGLSHGAEELVFLRFYQDPGALLVRKGKRGLGLGLFLARHITERHLGQLIYVRGRGSVFRFLWPLAGDVVLARGA